MSLKQNDKKIKVLSLLALLTVLVLGAGLIYQLMSINNRYNLSNILIGIETSQRVGEIRVDKGKDSPKDFYIAASKSGTKYYYKNCSGLGRIKPENLTFFNSESLAERAGYGLAKNCKKPLK